MIIVIIVMIVMNNSDNNSPIFARKIPESRLRTRATRNRARDLWGPPKY